MSAFLSPVGLSTTAIVANQVSLLATYKEKLCKCFSTISTNVPSAVVTYSNGTPSLVGSTVFVPVTAKIVVTIPSGCGCGCASTQLFNETFYVAFQGQTILPASVTINSLGSVQSPYNVSNGKSRSYAIEDSITVLIA